MRGRGDARRADECEDREPVQRRRSGGLPSPGFGTAQPLPASEPRHRTISPAVGRTLGSDGTAKQTRPAILSAAGGRIKENQPSERGRDWVTP
jgi:hypothetical protein